MMMNFKVNIVNKPKRQPSGYAIVRGVVGLCKQMEDGFKFYKTFGDEVRELPFSEDSYETKDRTKVFLKFHQMHGRPILLLRDNETKHISANYQYQTLCDNWVVKGNVISVKGKKFFQLKELIGKFNPDIDYDDDYTDSSVKW